MTDPDVKVIAQNHGHTVSQVLLKWAVQQNIGEHDKVDAFYYL